MKKFRVRFAFNVERIIEAKDEDKAIEIFSEKYEKELGDENKALENEVWESIESEEAKDDEEADYKQDEWRRYARTSTILNQ